MTYKISPKLTNRQIEFIKGTILGGSSIVQPSKGKNCYLSMRDKDVKWLEFKASEVMNINSTKSMLYGKTSRWHSICYPIFNEFKNMFYKGNKRFLNIEYLDQLKDIALTIWYGDCGNICKNQVILNTHVWGSQGTEIIREYFSCLGYKVEIFRTRQNWRIKLDAESSDHFLHLVSPHLPLSGRPKDNRPI